jgi:hypothetical protein
MLSAVADHHVKQAIVDGLRLHGMDVVTALERQWETLDDEALLTLATQDGRLLLTNDKGFLRRDSEWQRARRVHAGIVFWPQAKRSIGDVIRSVVVYASTTTAEDAAGRVEYV